LNFAMPHRWLDDANPLGKHASGGGDLRNVAEVDVTSTQRVEMHSMGVETGKGELDDG